jgi:hypothetical protein
MSKLNTISSKISVLLSVLLFVITILYTQYSSAEKIVSQEEVKAKFILNYLPYVSWQKDSLYNSSSPSVCFLEGDQTVGYFKEIAGNKAKVLIKMEHEAIDNCNILYISEIHKPQMGYYIKITNGKPIFTMSDIAGFVQKGGITSFSLEKNNEVKLYLNAKSLEKSSIDIDSDFLGIMTIVH